MTQELQLTIVNLTGDDVVTVDPDATLVDVARALVGADIGAVVVGSTAEEMMEHWVRHVLVEERGRLVGIVGP